MAIAFQLAVIRSARRVRVKFTAPLGMGAYSVSWFSFTSLDPIGASPGVAAALLVPTANDEIELALMIDLTQGCAYELDVAAGVPAADTSTAPPATARLLQSIQPGNPSQSVSLDDTQALVFGVDVFHDGNDFVENADGDLSTITGPENAAVSIVRRWLSEGLPHNASYGAHARDSVDAPNAALPTLIGRLKAQARQDDRVLFAEPTVEPLENDGTVQIGGLLTLVGQVKKSVSEVL